MPKQCVPCHIYNLRSPAIFRAAPKEPKELDDEVAPGGALQVACAGGPRQSGLVVNTKEVWGRRERRKKKQAGEVGHRGTEDVL